MADYDFPEDLLQLQRDFDAADAECERVAAALPRALDIVVGAAEITPEQRAELEAARAQRLRIAERLQTHEWWSTVDRAKAKEALRDAARA